MAAPEPVGDDQVWARSWRPAPASRRARRVIVSSMDPPILRPASGPRSPEQLRPASGPRSPEQLRREPMPVTPVTPSTSVTRPEAAIVPGVPSPATRWFTRVGIVAAVALAWLVLVVLRTSVTPIVEAVGVEAAVAETLLADRVLSVVQWITNVSATLVIGGLIFRFLVVRAPFGDRRGAAVLHTAAVIGAVASVMSVAPRAVAVSNGGLAGAWDPDVVRFVVESRFGNAAFLRAAGFVVVLALALTPPRLALRRVRRIEQIEAFASIVGVGLLLTAFVLVGHPRATSPAALLAAVQCVHILVVSAWFGGVTCLVFELRRLRERGATRNLADLVRRFSFTAMATVAVAGATGLLLAASQIASPEELISTGYGQALLAKLGVLAVPLALGAYNARRLVPALGTRDAPTAWRMLRRTLVAEAAFLAAGVLLFTTAMVTGGL